MSASAASSALIWLFCLFLRPHRTCSGWHRPWELHPRGITGCKISEKSDVLPAIPACWLIPQTMLNFHHSKTKNAFSVTSRAWLSITEQGWLLLHNVFIACVCRDRKPVLECVIWGLCLVSPCPAGCLVICSSSSYGGRSCPVIAQSQQMCKLKHRISNSQWWRKYRENPVRNKTYWK